MSDVAVAVPIAPQRRKGRSVIRSPWSSRNEPAIQERVARMGWRALVTNVPAERLSLSDSVAAYRGGWCLERDFHLVKDRPLGISPLYVRRDDQVVGLVHLVTLALRVLTLFEILVRRGQEQQRGETTGIVPGSSEPHDGPPNGLAGARGDRAGRDHREPGGRWTRPTLASDSSAEAGETSAGLPGAGGVGVRRIVINSS